MEVNKIHLGDSLELLKKTPDNFVDCIVTSPPYWALRNYGVKGQLGLEPTFEEYITKLCDLFDEAKRVLKPTGTCFVNIGDTYMGNSSYSESGRQGFSGSEGHMNQDKWPDPKYKAAHGSRLRAREHVKQTLKSKSLVGIPFRFALEMINRGWILRNTIIWHKPNCMPSSASDRFTVDFEYVFFFVKSCETLFWANKKTGDVFDTKPLGTNGKEGYDWEWRDCKKCEGKGEIENKDEELVECPRCKGRGEFKYNFWEGHDYWFEQQFEPHIWANKDRRSRIQRLPKSGKILTNQYAINKVAYGPEGKNKRAVWRVTTKPFSGAHFATFPEDLIEPMIKGGCPNFVCNVCGVPREQIKEPTKEYAKFLGKSWHDHKDDMGMGFGQQTRGFSSRKGNVSGIKRYDVKGWTDCGCKKGFKSGVVLDPFMGAGTTALVARKLGRDFLGFELNQKYIKIANKRIRPWMEQQKLEVMGVKK